MKELLLCWDSFRDQTRELCQTGSSSDLDQKRDERFGEKSFSKRSAKDREEAERRTSDERHSWASFSERDLSIASSHHLISEKPKLSLGVCFGPFILIPAMLATALSSSQKGIDGLRTGKDRRMSPSPAHGPHGTAQADGR